MKVIEVPPLAETEHPDAEALIKEARSRQRKRWLFIGMVALVVAAASATAVVLSRGSPSKPPSIATKGPVPPGTTASCSAQSLSVGMLGVQPQAGSAYGAIFVHNLSRTSCKVAPGPITLRPYRLVAGKQKLLPYGSQVYSCTRGGSSGLGHCYKPVVLAGHGFASFAVVTGELSAPCVQAKGFLVRLPGISGTLNLRDSLGYCGGSVAVGALLIGCGAQQVAPGQFIVVSASDVRLAGCRLVKE